MTQPIKVADLFCGAGGSSTGARRAIRALGATMDLIAVNHWPRAVATHQKNHPHAKHYVQDVNNADPEQIVPEGRLDLLMASPECTFYSRARGGKPVKPQGRMSPWAINRWLSVLDVRTLIVENVPEIVDWGPLIERSPGTWIPDPDKKGLYFQAWVKSLWEMGYAFEWRFLNAADFGDATTRTRFFGIGRNDGLPIVWPEPSHSKTGSKDLFGQMQRWRSAREVIDWKDAGRSLLDDPKYQTRPLSIKTRMRIARGLARFGGPLASLYIELLDIDPSKVDVPAGRGVKPQAFVLAQGDGGESRPVDQPIPTMVTKGYVTLTSPFLIGQYTNNIAQGVDEKPVPTIPTIARIRLIEPMLAPYYSATDSCVSTDKPVPTISTKDRFALIDPLAVPYGPRTAARPVDQPLPTVMTRDRLGVVIPTAEPFIVSRQGHSDPTGRVRPVSAPLSTITGSGSGTGYLVEPFIVPKFGEHEGQLPRVHSLDDPLPTVTGVGAGRLVQPMVVDVELLQKTETGGVDSRRVVHIDGEPFILDIRFRMLKNRELARAMGFDDDEQNYEFTGTATEITKQIGNAVPCNLAKALVSVVLAPSITQAHKEVA